MIFRSLAFPNSAKYFWTLGFIATLAAIVTLRPSLSYGLDNSDLVTQCVSRTTVAAEKASDATHEVATKWGDFMLDIMQDTQGFTPPVMSRVLAYTSIALYESVVPSDNRLQSFAGRLIDMPPMPKPAHDRQYYWPAVANGALASIFADLIAQSPYDEKNMAAIKRFKKEIAHVHHSRGISARTLRRSEKFGLDIARAVYTWSMSDGAHEAHINNFPPHYSIPKGYGLWEPTSPRLYPALQPYWGEKRTFVLNGSEELTCGLPPAIEYSEDKESEFYAEAKEVYDTVNNLTEEQLAIAIFWEDNPRRTSTPAGHSFSILTQLLRKERASLMFAAEAYAKTAIALADSFVGCWQEKYRWNVIRPVTYIKRHIDKKWATAVSTPPFPEYPSGHSVQTGAVTTILEDLFGKEYTFTDHTHDRLNYKPRTFTSFKQMGDETAMSRLYGGIHYRAAIEKGIDQGRCIGKKVLDRLKR